MMTQKGQCRENTKTAQNHAQNGSQSDVKAKRQPQDGTEDAGSTMQGVQAGKAPQPVRRVGSVTLGLTLIAIGAGYLCYYFLPGFRWLLVMKIAAPLTLVSMGLEVLYCTARCEQYRYDFAAVLESLFLVCAALFLATLPLAAGKGICI